ncbi:GAF domain-containing protein [Iningainema tapete]|uniref:GAF domain-containing protein n=1 Tax=Iningainema tapete BLCC-T55 TaxID=2748662 RepID=A0A8J7C9A5_9CYAN|nr:GAF domain-containing protein [Iningainema tapete]MBD2770805.1 GAF domain-containing protein [Iningainema tapete BLCC-T55]
MTTLYQNGQENTHIVADVERLEVNNGNKISQQFKTWRRQLQEVVTKMRQASDLDTLLKVTTQEVREKLNSDRVLIYRFNSDKTGVVIGESKTTGWTPTLGENLPSIIFGLDARQDDLEYTAINDINQIELSPYQKQLLEKFQVKASLSLPILVDGKIWGVLAVNNCSSGQQWQEEEISLLSQITTELTYRLQSFEIQRELQQQTQVKKAVAKVINKILRVLDVDKVFQTTTQEVRQLLRCDRVAVYRFNPDWGGEFVTESVGNGWVRLVEKDIKTVWEDSHLQETQGGRYAQGESFAVNDIYQVGHAQCHIEILEQFEVKAYMIVPVFSGEKLWGLLAAYQNSNTRNWQAWEVSFLSQIGLQFGVAISQAEYLAQLRLKSEQLAYIADQEKALAKVINRIRQSFNIDTIFKTSTQEVRQLLRCDRVAVYRFNPDWGGEFVTESVGSGWVRLVGQDIKIVWEDSHLQETQGGRYAKGESFAVNDIYQVGHAPCHIEILEQFEIKAYMIVPVLSGEKLWGLLAAYQNSNTREWQAWEVSMLSRIGDQLGLALQQAEYLQKLQAQSAQLAEVAAREKTAKELLQQRCIQLIKAVIPALNGDLTVRVEITEDELGTIADAYNNTLQALREIVIQVQQAAQQVAQTNSSSDASLAKLTALAQQQSEEITEALGELQQMVDSTQAVATSAELVQVAVKSANQTVESGDAAMNLTVEAIQGIRETVAQTSKKIKRLSESSQKISKVVNLISNFATQTNVLALNAAIEATRAGEYGKGFAVVADEVRSLSRQSAAATIEIEKLVQEIQAETGEVAVAMETGIQQVVEGTNLVNQTRQNLNAIVTATAEISKLLQQITSATQSQKSQSVLVTTSMNDVAELANKTFAEANEIAAVFQQSSSMVQQLLASASKFKVN